MEFFNSRFDPFRDTVDILLVTAGIYWLLLLIRGTRAIQILVGLIVLIALSLASELFQLAALGMILERFLGSAVLIIVILFQNDIRRALARVGRGFFPSFSAEQETQVVEEIVRTAGDLSQRRHGALIVLERESNLGDQIEAGVPVDAQISKELLTSIFQPSSPMHDGAVLIQEGRISSAGCILPLTLRTDLPEGLGTRHRAAVGITEETDALVVVVSEETAKISVVLGGQMLRELDAPRLRVLLRDILSGERKELPDASEITRGLEIAETNNTSGKEGEQATAS
ncbi:MAG TPA: TIGR00159 family protein [Myxococcales bacterium]|nr:TIGR00159 family protein [Myxococcales bacterium]HIL80238.1 TIGR00159 family protein [Myxococcales bacterium]